MSFSFYYLLYLYPSRLSITYIKGMDSPVSFIIFTIEFYYKCSSKIQWSIIIYLSFISFY